MAARGVPARRFIPARAGNTKRLHASRCPVPVHPRSRGEHLLPGIHGPTSRGSSPLARGTRPRRMPPRCGARFIPARAGNTDSWRCYTSVGPVHPRSRGEHIRPARPRGARTGSSPLARGTRMSGRLAVAPVRFIPARAGNTGWGGTGAAGSAVHPRSRGEHSTAAALGLELTGSSPLARGTPHARRRQRRCLRFIPARAGNTTAASQMAWSSAVHPRSRGEHAG